MTLVRLKVGVDYKWAKCNWTFPPAETAATILENWRLIAAVGTADQIASGEISAIAAANWRTACDSIYPPATSIESLRAEIIRDEWADVMCMCVLQANWFPDDYLGVCLFERTWANSIFLSSLSSHPSASREEYKIAGVGQALLYHLCGIAEAIDAKMIWAQTTKDSSEKYRKIFALDDPVTDQLVVPAKLIKAYLENYKTKWLDSEVPSTDTMPEANHK